MTDEQKEIFNRPLSPYKYRTMSRKSNKRKKSKRDARRRGKKLVTKITAMLRRLSCRTLKKIGFLKIIG